ncbi:Fc.00g063580.m01.CDS01 [Cosmosporella sp. VM-42]
MSTPEDLVIIGKDFGTTFSGVAWAYSREPDDIALVTNWDAELNNCSDVEKAPTQLHYGGQSEANTWGYSVPLDKNPLRWFKLLLLDDRDVPEGVATSPQIREARRLQKEINKDPVDIIGCFLRHIWNHSIDSIRRTISAELLQKCKFHVVITLPAIWPHYTQRRMEQAAKLSGILDERSSGETILRFISEPEAAALATIKDFSRRSTTKPGDTIVVCDAGGGTVDLISYVIETVEPFVIKECVKGDGDLCGGVFLDAGFIDLIKKKVTAEAWGQVSKAEERKFLNDGWEHGIKPQFQNQQRTWLVDLPESCSHKKGAGLKRKRAIELSSSDIKSVFSPVMVKIEALVERQSRAVKQKYSAPPKHIILVGGFGRSRYLFDRLQASFGPSTAVLQSQGNKPWTAICRGAVVRGLTEHDLAQDLGVKIEARIARISYGIDYQTPWVPGKHLECDKVWREAQYKYMATRQMNWFLKQDEDMTTKEPIRRQYTRYFSEPIGKVQQKIYCSTQAPPPTRYDSTVRLLCTISFTQEFSMESLPTYTNEIGKIYHRLDFDIEMTCDQETVDFTIYHQDKRIGARNVEVEFS